MNFFRARLVLPLVYVLVPASAFAANMKAPEPMICSKVASHYLNKYYKVSDDDKAPATGTRASYNYDKLGESLKFSKAHLLKTEKGQPVSDELRAKHNPGLEVYQKSRAKTYDLEAIIHHISFDLRSLKSQSGGPGLTKSKEELTQMLAEYTQKWTESKQKSEAIKKQFESELAKDGIQFGGKALFPIEAKDPKDKVMREAFENSDPATAWRNAHSMLLEADLKTTEGTEIVVYSNTADIEGKEALKIKNQEMRQKVIDYLSLQRFAKRYPESKGLKEELKRRAQEVRSYDTSVIYSREWDASSDEVHVVRVKGIVRATSIGDVHLICNEAGQVAKVYDKGAGEIWDGKSCDPKAIAKRERGFPRGCRFFFSEMNPDYAPTPTPPDSEKKKTRPGMR